MMIKAILLDFDGTLVDSIQPIWIKYRQTADALGIPAPEYSEFTAHIGRPWHEVLEGVWPGIDVEEFTKAYRAEDEVVYPIEGVRETLANLRRKYVLGIVTSRGDKSLRKHLGAVGLNQTLFEVVFNREASSKHKPHPGALLQACSKIGIKPDEMVYVGDSIVDAECAESAGVPFIGVLTGGASREDFNRLGVKHIIESLINLPELLEKI